MSGALEAPLTQQLWPLIGATAALSAALGLLFSRQAPPGEGSRPDRFAPALAVVCGLLYLNQVAFQVYVYEEHAGRTDFLGARLPAIFFSHMAPDHPPVRWLLAQLDGAAWLEPSVLRVQAVLELPFAMLAYLSVAALVDRSAARQIARGALGLASALSYTVVLMAIEVLLWNRYTADDLWLRGLAVVLTVPLLRWLAGPPVAADGASWARLASFLLGLGAMAVLVVIVNLVALLYNLGWLSTLGAPLAAFTVLFGLARWLSYRPGPSSEALFVRTAFAFGRRFVLIFSAPALAIRYGWTHDRARAPALVALGLAVLASLALGGRDLWRTLPPDQRGGWSLRFGLASLLGLGACGLDLAALSGQPMLAVSDAWFVQKAMLLGSGFMCGWISAGALTGSLARRPRS